MALSNFLSKLNWRLILVHFIACWFIFKAFDYFGICYDYHFMKDFYNHHHFSKHMTDNEFRSINVNDWKRILNDGMIINIVPVASLLITLILSLTISIRKKWFWVNAVFVFFVAFSLLILWRVFKIEITPWTLLGYIFRAPGYFFKGTIWYFIINGSVLLAIGLALFFWKKIIRFIDGAKTHLAEVV